MYVYIYYCFSFLETNIDEVLTLPDLSTVPETFITEIQQDKVYGTILQELQKKLPHRTSPTTPPPFIAESELEDEQTRRQTQEQTSKLSFLVDNSDENIIDNDTNIDDDSSSTASSETNLLSPQDGYDTDIESG